MVEKHAQTMLQLVEFCMEKCGELEQINIPVAQIVEEISEK